MRKMWKKCLVMVLGIVLLSMTVLSDDVYAKHDDELSDIDAPTLVETVSPDNITINLFDYRLDDVPDGQPGDDEQNQPRDLDNMGGMYWERGDDSSILQDLREAEYLNKGHALLFGKGISGKDDPLLVTTTEDGKEVYVDQWGVWNWCDSKDYQPRQGLVKPELDDGYPQLNLFDYIANFNEVEIGGIVVDKISGGIQKGTMLGYLSKETLEESLAYLFDPDKEVDGKTTYKNVTGLLQYGTYDNGAYGVDGSYTKGNRTFNQSFYYDSRQNYAEYNINRNSFTLYSQPRIAPSPDNGDVIGQFFPFQPWPGLGALKADDSKLNHYFGMTLETDFYMPEDGTIGSDDMVFYFSGDDDAWIFVDGVLVGDVGGMHSPIGVTINFRTGKITYDDTGNTISSLEEAFSAAGKESELEYGTLKVGEKHKLKMFYMERGNYDSNLALSFNLYNPYNDYELKKEVVDEVGNPVVGDTTEFLFDMEFDKKDVVQALLLGSYDYEASTKNGITEKGIVEISVPAGETVGQITAIKGIKDSNGNPVTNSTYFEATTGTGQFAGQTVYRAKLKNGDSIKILNLPDKAVVTTTELPTAGYKLNGYTISPEENVDVGTAATGTFAVAAAKLYPIASTVAGMTGLTTVTYSNTKIPTGTLNISKTVEANAGVTPPDSEFEFTLTIPGQTDALTAQRAPTTGGNTEDITLNFANGNADFKLTAGQSLSLILPVGTNYTVTEKKNTLPAGFALKEVSLNETAAAAGAAAVSGTILIENQEARVAFVNSYTEPTVSFVLQARKTLSGRTFMEGDSFTFTMTGEDGAPMPAGTAAGGTYTKTISYANGMSNTPYDFDFAAISYKRSEADSTYTYKLIETAGNKTGITYDTQVKTVRVTVAEDAQGNLTVTAVYPDPYPDNVDRVIWRNTYASLPATVNVNGTKAVADDYTMTGEEFHFRIVPSNRNPKPDPVSVGIVSNEADGTIKFLENASYTVAGTYRYDVHELSVQGLQATVPGIIYDDTVYTITVVVEDNPTAGAMEASVTYTNRNSGSAVNGIVFDNDYEAPNTSVILWGSKTLSGKNLTDNEFTFKLTEIDADGKETASGTAVNTETGIFVFDEITYSEEGTHTYKISEVNDGKPGYSYDNAEYTVTVNVTANNGQLTATVNGLDNVTFENGYENPGPPPEEPTPEEPTPENPTPPNPTPQKPTSGGKESESTKGTAATEVNSPRTSDDSHVVLLILLLVAGIIAEGGIICVKRIKSSAARQSEK